MQARSPDTRYCGESGRAAFIFYNISLQIPTKTMICIPYLEIGGKFALSVDGRGKKSAFYIPVGNGRVVVLPSGLSSPSVKRNKVAAYCE